MLPSIYRIDAVRFEVDAAYTNKCPSGAYRGVGWTSGQTAREALDRRHRPRARHRPARAAPEEHDPRRQYVSATGCRYDGGSFAAAQRKAAELVDYAGFRERQRTARAEGRYLGVGFSPFLEPGGWSGELAKRMGFPFDYMDTATVTVDPTATSSSASACTRTARRTRRPSPRSSRTSSGCRSRASRSSRATRRPAAYGSGTFGSRGAVIALRRRSRGRPRRSPTS